MRAPVLPLPALWLAAACAALLATLAAAPGLAQAAPRTMGDGAWSWFADPRGVRYDGLHRRTYVGWVAEDGDIKVAAYDHDSLTRTTALLESRLQIDDHSNPALQVRADGRIRVFYSAHNGATLYYRTTRNPEDLTSWEAPQAIPTNTSGTRGFTYPNPIRLSAEQKSYLFWRGGNYNPTFSSQPDGGTNWSSAANLVMVSGQRPYVKYASNKTDTIGFAFTNAHPNAVSDVNIYYAYYRAGSLYRVNGTRIGSLGQAISPSQASKVYDTASKAWVHDVALDTTGRPVIVFAAFPSTSDHRYMYARWTGSSWSVSQITPAGGSISLDGKEPYYSGGLTLDHEDPSTVYLSRDVAGVFQVETWKTMNGGATWTKQDVSAPDTVNNLRPISPRGLIPFSGDLSVVWIRGIYNSYVDYTTSITTVLASGGNSAPVADAELAPRSGPAPQPVDFDGSASRDPDGSIATWSWDFGDGAPQGSGSKPSHVYTAPGRYFPALTVTDNAGARDVFVAEVVVDSSAPPTASTGAASAISATGATLHATVNPRNQPTTFRFEYGPTTAYGSSTSSAQVSPMDNSSHDVAASLTGLAEGQTHHYRVVATNATGTTTGADRTLTTAPPAPSAYRSAVLGTAGLIAYWRLGEPTGTASADETGANPGSYSGGFTLGDPGALTGDSNPSARFDGVSGEMTAPAAGIASAGTLEGWFDWRGGVAMMRDNTSGNGWILGYDSGGSLWYRAGGSAFNSGRTTASVRGAWHHIALTKDGGTARLYLDGALIHTGTGAASAVASTPWHVMRNGTYAQYAAGNADEVAVYDRALPASTIAQHYQVGRGQ